MSTDETEFMRLAIEHAGRSKLEPGAVRPKVGAVVVLNGEILASGHRGEISDGEHAEFTVLEKKLHATLVAGATVYTTLEPCTTRNHPKTPCAEHLIARKVKRVWIGMVDPNPVISGRGLRRLRDANIEVQMFPPDLAAQVEEQNRAFTKSFLAGSAASPARRSTPGLKAALFLVCGLLAFLVGLLVYTRVGANDLRRTVYVPLASELNSVREALAVVSLSRPPSMPVFAKMKKDGTDSKLPPALRTQLVGLSAKCSLLLESLDSVRDLVVRESSDRILRVRSQEIDREWFVRISEALREESRPRKGVPDRMHISMNGLLGMTHEGRSRLINIETREVAAPGGPTLVMRDWLAYPTSVEILDNMLTEKDYLYFHDTEEHWYYKITREDLQRQHLSLQDFLRPIYQVLERDRDFQVLQQLRPALIADLGEVQAIVEARVKSPKHVGDLVRKN